MPPLSNKIYAMTVLPVGVVRVFLTSLSTKCTVFLVQKIVYVYLVHYLIKWVGRESFYHTLYTLWETAKHVTENARLEF